MGVAAVVGLSLGGYMKPVLKISDGPEGPQLLMPVSAVRTAYVDHRGAYDSYRFGIPDFVIGTDWLKSFEVVYAEPEPEPEPEHVYETARYDSPPAPVIVYDQFEPEPKAPSYPSMGGGILANVADEASPPPPAPEVTAEAPLVGVPAA